MNVDGDDSKRSSKSNAKAVEAYDLDGNLIAVYPSGSLASQALNIQQGDISLCCRGIKPSVGKYKFKFASDAEEPVDTTKLKRGYALEVVPIEEEVKPQPEKTENIISSRMTRTSRGEYGIDYRDQTSKIASELSTVRSRKWQRVYVKIGGMVVQKWLPSTELPTAELQQMKMVKADKKKPQRRNVARNKTISKTGVVNYMETDD